MSGIGNDVMVRRFREREPHGFRIARVRKNDIVVGAPELHRRFATCCHRTNFGIETTSYLSYRR